MFCIYLRTNSDLCYLQHKLIGFYNRDEKCLQRGTDWVLKYGSQRFVCKGLRNIDVSLYYGKLCTKNIVLTLMHLLVYCDKTNFAATA